ncbi:hypothetical protein GWI33_010645 [Rhynchophorus ferrugineus]|uniref:Uncharacterized protein n=1 Tax=Rhynchophorus ferrugineus TaxID=354439 RepID=A0A834IQJ3_RHYFE|nr:hypothetical protein GWI33_010645 [Rhynchophorus ferrugineus]
MNAVSDVSVRKFASSRRYKETWGETVEEEYMDDGSEHMHMCKIAPFISASADRRACSNRRRAADDISMREKRIERLLRN